MAMETEPQRTRRDAEGQKVESLESLSRAERCILDGVGAFARADQGETVEHGHSLSAAERCVVDGLRMFARGDACLAEAEPDDRADTVRATALREVRKACERLSTNGLISLLPALVRYEEAGD